MKGKALRRDPRVALCVDDERPPFSFVSIEGTVTLSEQPDEVLRWATKSAARYMGADLAEEIGTCTSSRTGGSLAAAPSVTTTMRRGTRVSCRQMRRHTERDQFGQHRRLSSQLATAEECL